MTDGFHQTPDGFLVASFSATEARVLRSLLGEIIELLRDGAPESSTSTDDPFAALLGDVSSGHPPEDPVVARLLPAAYADDDEAAGEFRRYTEMGLRDGKVRNAETVLTALGGEDEDPTDLPGFGVDEEREIDVQLGADDVQAWLRTLTDLRLALATRLGIEQDDEDDWYGLPPDDPVRQVYQVYSWLGFVQETLITSL